MADLTGKQFGPYQIVERLGEGGMSVVYKAYQPSTDRYVAIKILPPYYAFDPVFAGRFEQEARTLAKLNHAHILPLFDYGKADDYAYIVMPFVETGTLATLMKKAPLPLEQIRHIISQVGSALNYAHANGLVHRDVKPENVMIDEGGNCRLTDFGVAKIVEAPQRLTRDGTSVGTPAYMSPEQIRGKEIDGRSDIYSLGVMLYEMVTGRPPFEATTTIEIMIKHMREPLPPPRTIKPDLPEALEQVIIKALAKEPAERYTTAAEMVQALRAAIPETSPSKLVPTNPFIERGALTPAEPPAKPKPTEQAQPKSSSLPIYLLLGCAALIGLFACLAGVGLIFYWGGNTVVAEVTPSPTPKPSPTPTELPPTPTDTPTPENTTTPTPSLPSPTPTDTPAAQANLPIPLPTSTASATATPTPAPLLGRVNQDAVNLRSGPGTSYERLGRLGIGTELTLLRRTAAADWLEIETLTAQQKGWISTEFVTTSANIQTLEVAQNLPPTPTRGASTSSGLIALNLGSGSSSGTVGANGSQWFTFTSGENTNAIMVAFLRNAERAELIVYLENTIPDGRIPPNPDQLPNVGVGSEQGNRDGDSNTKELIWAGGIQRNTRYYLRLANRSGAGFQYCLAPRDAYSCP